MHGVRSRSPRRIQIHKPLLPSNPAANQLWCHLPTRPPHRLAVFRPASSGDAAMECLDGSPSDLAAMAGSGGLQARSWARPPLCRRKHSLMTLRCRVQGLQLHCQRLHPTLLLPTTIRATPPSTSLLQRSSQTS